MAESDDPEIIALARWVIGLALHELGRPAEAAESYRVAIALGVEHRLPDTEAQARAGLAVSLVSVGDADGAVAQMALARAVAQRATRGVVEMLHGLVQQRTGKLAEAQVTYSRALPQLEEAGELGSIARLRLNRGILRAYRGDSAGAIDDLAAAEALASARDLPVLVAMAAHNLGFAYGRRGDLPQALTAFTRAESAYGEVRRPGLLVAVLEADRCEVLLLAGLLVEARSAAQTAVDAVASTGDVAYRSECRLLLARALLAGGTYHDATTEASAVAADFRRAGRLPWAALADYVAIQAEMLAGEDQVLPPAGLLTRCRQVAIELQQQGWSVEAVHARTFVGRLALAAGQPEVARVELAQALNARRRGTADLRAQAWHAGALLLVAEGDRAGARRALAHGMRVIAEHQATLGATELRSRAAGHGSDLARLGIRLAVEDRRPADVLRWAERWRGSSLRHRPVRPPDDDQLVADLAELRRVRSQMLDAGLAGEPTQHLDRAAMTIEAAVRRRLRQSPGDATVDGRLDLAALRRQLGGRTLVEYVDFEGRLYALTVTATRTRLAELAAVDDVARERAYLMFELRRAQRQRPEGPFDQGLAVSAERLDRMLVAPLSLPEGEPVVVVPTGILHGLAWGCLPSLATRDLTMAPSAALWVQRPTREVSVPAAAGSARVSLVAGPGLPGAESETRQLAALYPGAHVLTGAAATAAAAIAALTESDVVHLAAHGNFRADSPLFSSILLADGPLTVHDLEHVAHAAPTVVLASCNAGVTGVERGDELIGTAATLLALGVRSIVAPVVAVPDMPTASFMVALHRQLRSGLSPSAALAAARSGAESVVASAFVCIGRDRGATGDTTARQ